MTEICQECPVLHEKVGKVEGQNEIILNKLSGLCEKVDKISGWKNKIIGGAIATSLIISGSFQLVLLLLK